MSWPLPHSEPTPLRRGHRRWPVLEELFKLAEQRNLDVLLQRDIKPTLFGDEGDYRFPLALLSVWPHGGDRSIVSAFIANDDIDQAARKCVQSLRGARRTA